MPSLRAADLRLLEAVRAPLVSHAGARDDPWAERLKAPEPRKPAGGARPLALLGAVVAILLLLAFVVARGALVAALPDLAGLYTILGLPVNLDRIAISDVSAAREAGSPVRILVRGRLVNLSSEPVPLPGLEAVMEDGHGRVVAVSSFEAPVTRLAGEAEAPFSFSLDAPADAAHVSLRLGEAAPPKPPEGGEGAP